MNHSLRRTPLMRSGDVILATGRFKQHKQPKNNHAPLPARSFEKSLGALKGWVFMGFFYSFVMH